MIRASIPWNVKQVSRMFESGCLHFDNAIQRGNVWDVKRQSLLIDSILRGYPIPPMYTIKTEEKIKTAKGMAYVYDCIDGKQRCTALNRFRTNQFALTGLEPFIGSDGEEIDLNGKTYDDLDEDLRDEFDSYSLTVNYFTDITEDEICEMMARLNNGKPLTGVENARIKAKNLPKVISLAQHDLFIENLTEAVIAGYANEDIVIKTVMQISGNYALSTKNVKIGYENFDFDDAQVAQLESLFDTTYQIINTAKGQMSKKNASKIVKKTNLLSIIQIADRENIDCEEVARKVAEFFGGNDKIDSISLSEDYNNASINGTDHADNVVTRNSALAEYIFG